MPFRTATRRTLRTSPSYFSKSYTSAQRTPAFGHRTFFTHASSLPRNSSTRLNIARTGFVAATSLVAGGYFLANRASPHYCDDPTTLPADVREAETTANLTISKDAPMRDQMEHMIRTRQQKIVKALEEVDGKKFFVDSWSRPEGGGGISCVLQEGNVFEKAGVNISIVNGTLPPAAVKAMRANHKSLGETAEATPFFAAGLSMVLHPKNPMAPTVHLNYRYFETMKPDGTTASWWFGGGTDLTPSYIFEDDCVHFHKTLKEACDRHDETYYPKFKKWCDVYFRNVHRNESRGVGGIFFDDLDDKKPEELLKFATDCLDSFLPGYIPIIEKRKNMPFTPEQKDWQQIRRGRYVEFNLVHDRGTAFGLRTPGARTESILMSLPLTASWKYMHFPEPGSREAELVEILQNPKEWV